MSQDQSALLQQLATLQQKYRSWLEHHELRANYVREQLVHINALLVDQLLPPSVEFSVDSISAEIKSSLPKVEDLEILRIESPDNGVQATEEEQETTPAAPTPAPSKLSAPPKSVAPPKPPVASKPPAASKSSTEGPETWVAEYEGLSKIEAAGKILQKRVGQVVHVDDIIEELYGPLDVDEMKAERSRMRNTLLRGVKQRRWVKVKDRQASYILPPKSSSSRKGS